MEYHSALWPGRRNAIAITVDDRRSSHEPISAVLRMLRYEPKYPGPRFEKSERDHVVTVPYLSHTAASRLQAHRNRIALTQEFREATYRAKSVVAVAVAGQSGTAEVINETEVRLLTEGAGQATIFISSAATFDPKGEVADTAFQVLDDALAKGFPELERETLDWWHKFWARSFVQLHSEDGTADFVQQNYHYFLYLMGASSRGKYPPKFNGMLWNNGGDLRAWGAQHWFANLSCYYEALPAANRFDLMDPMFDMYSGMVDACSVAARQQWGSKGIYIPETVYFDGLEELPKAIATEMRELYLLQKPWEQRSKEFMEFAQTKHPQSSRWY